MANKKKRGFTLVELIVTLTIVGISGIFMVSFLVPQINSYNKFSAATDAKYMCATLFDVLEPELRFGKNFRVENEGELLYDIVEAVAPDTEDEIVEKMCLAEYDRNSGEVYTSFIPENRVIKMEYEVDHLHGGWVNITMVVCDATDPDNPLPIYQETAPIRSMYAPAQKPGEM